MEIKDVSIPDIYVPDVPAIYTPYYNFSIKPLDIEVIGCTYQHRDIKNTGNRNLLIEDPNGVFTTCDFPFPSFIPLDYTPENLILVEEPLGEDMTPEIPDTDPPKLPNNEPPPDPPFVPCPSNKDLRVGDFRNDKKLERVVAHKKIDNECVTIYEDVAFVDQYIPSAPQFVGVFSLALVGASAPLVLNLVRPLVKQAVSKLTKQKKDVE